MWKRPAVPASSKERCEGWDSFTVPRFAGLWHFHGLCLCHPVQVVQSANLFRMKGLRPITYILYSESRKSLSDT